MTIIIPILLLNLCMLLVPMTMGRIGISTLSSSSRPSAVNVGALFTMNSVIGRSVKPAIEAAIEDVNSDPNILGGTKLNLISHDTNCTGFLAIVEALELMKKNVVAIIGPQSSGLAHIISHEVNEVQIPLLSFGATDPTLSSLHYPYFLRTTHSDYFQMNAIADLVDYYGWKEVTAIYVDDDYGRNGISVLGDALAKRRAKISYKAAVSPGAPKIEIHDLLVEVMLMESRVYVVHANPDSGVIIFSEAKNLQMMTDGYVWIATDWLSSVLDSSSESIGIDDQMDLLQGVVALRHHTPDSNIKKSFTTRWKNLNSYALYAYDSVWLLARALDVFFTEGGNINLSSDPKPGDTNSTVLDFTASLPIFDEGQRLLRILTTMNFTGLSGQIKFDEGKKNLIHPAYDVLNIVGTNSRRIGYWSNYYGLSIIPPENLYMNPPNTSTSNQHLYSVIWPGGSATKPRGWVFPNNGKPLQIAVPYRVTYTEFATKNKGPIGVSGYCIDVFEAALNLLPYPVPHVYILYGNGLSNPSYKNMVTDVSQNKYDAAVGNINILPNRMRIVDFTEAYMNSELVILSRVEKLSSTTWAFLKPFTVGMWCVTGVAFLFVGTVIWILEHQANHEFRGPPRHGLVTVLWFSFSTMVFAHRQNIMSTLGRLVMILWLFVVLIITSSYTASLSSILTAQQLTSRIEGIDNLKSSSDPIGVEGRSFAYDYLINELGIAESRLKKLKNHEEYVKALHRGPKGGGVAAIVDELPYVKIFLSEVNCEFRIVEQLPRKCGWGFAFQRDSLLAIDLSTAIRQLSEDGGLQSIQDKWFRSNRCSLQEDQVDNNKLSLESFWGLFLICGIACFLSLTVFFYKVFRQYLENSPKKDEENVTEELESRTGSRRTSFKDFVDKEEDTEIKETMEQKIVDKQEASESSTQLGVNPT